MDTEIWKDIQGYEGLYKVSNLGNIISSYNRNGKKNLSLFKNKNGYVRLFLYKNSSRKRYQVHRLVATAFIENKYSKPFINHKNGVKNDNRVENLEWCTGSQNIKYNYEVLGQQGPKSWLGKKGSKHPTSIKVIQMDAYQNELKVWECMKDASTHLGVCLSSISQCCSGKRKSAGGFTWKYL